MGKEIFDGLKGCLGRLFVTGSYRLMQVLDFLLCGYLLWGPLLSTPGSAPGARDGTGLIFLFLLWLVATCLCTALLATLQAMILKSLFPWWEPPVDDDIF